MAIISCRECGNEISDESEYCVHCGCSTVPIGDIDKRCIQCGAWLRSNYCSRCGYSAVKSKEVRRKLGLALLLLALIFVAVAIIIVIAMSTEPTKGVSQQGGITLAQFNTVEMGMTYQEVCEMMGSNGELISEVDLNMGPEYVTKIFLWKGNTLGANASVTFQGEKATAKAQFGLT